MNQDITIKVFDNFYNVDLLIDASQYDVVYSFFSNYTTNEKVAKSFTEILFRISNLTNTDVIDLLQTFQAQDSMKIALTMCYYLNTIAPNKTVLYGIDSELSPNNSVQRNIVG